MKLLGNYCEVKHYQLFFVMKLYQTCTKWSFWRSEVRVGYREGAETDIQAASKYPPVIQQSSSFQFLQKDGLVQTVIVHERALLRQMETPGDRKRETVWPVEGGKWRNRCEQKKNRKVGSVRLVYSRFMKSTAATLSAASFLCVQIQLTTPANY